MKIEDLKEYLRDKIAWRRFVKFITGVMVYCFAMRVQVEGYYSLYIVQHVLACTAHVLLVLFMEHYKRTRISLFSKNMYLVYGMMNMVAGICVACNIRSLSPKESYMEAGYNYIRKGLSMEIYMATNSDFIAISGMSFLQGISLLTEMLEEAN